MSKVTLTFTDDLSDGTVQILAEPKAIELRQKIERFGPESITPAEAYALACLTHVFEHATATRERSKIILRPGKD